MNESDCQEERLRTAEAYFQMGWGARAEWFASSCNGSVCSPEHESELGQPGRMTAGLFAQQSRTLSGNDFNHSGLISVLTSFDGLL
jgi:hypothetical protein